MSEKTKQTELELNEKKQTRDDGPVECLGMTFDNDEARRKHFLDLLAKKLKDPEFRKIEGFPIGEDEDILTLSDPPYYTACPNPWIGDFVKCYGKAYDPNVPYAREPFASDVSEGKQDPVCMAHTYHTKVPYRAIMRFIMHYTEPGDLILDSFAGTGMTGLAAQLCARPDAEFKSTIEQRYSEIGGTVPKWGIRRTLMCDLSPFATFLERNYNSCLSPEGFKSEATKLLAESEARWGWVYKTGLGPNDQKATFRYGLWVDTFFCECGQELLIWDPQDLENLPAAITPAFRCAKCGANLSKNADNRSRIAYFDDTLSKNVTQNKQVLALIEAGYMGEVFRKKPTQGDFALIGKIAKTPFDHYAPNQPMMFDKDGWGDMYRAGIHYGISHAHHFWTKRNLLVLSDLFAEARKSKSVHEMLFLCTSFAVKTGSRMHNVGFKDGKINLAGQTYNTLQFPSVSAERNLFELARGKMDDLSAVFDIMKSCDSVLISTVTATNLKGISDSIVDYIFIDPPFGDNIIYSELSFLYEAWLRVFTNREREAIISTKQEKDLFKYQGLMLSAFQELFRVLKPGRWATVAFHNSKNAVWNSIQEALGQAGFVVGDVRTLDKGQGTYKQMTTMGAVKQDLLISAYKPNGGLEDRFKLEAGTAEGVWDFLRTHIRQLPVFVSKDGKAEIIAERQNYLLFDRMVAFHVQRGVTVPLSASEFYQGLSERFSERDSMFFLPEQTAEYDKKRMTVREVEELSLFVIDEASAIQWLHKQLKEKPQTFQEIQPRFLQEIGAWQKHEKPLELMTLLRQNFLPYEGIGEVPCQIHTYLSSNFKELRNLKKDSPLLVGKAKDRWYVPDPSKSGDIEKMREKDLLKEFWQYLPEGYKPKVVDDLQLSMPELEPKSPTQRAKKLKIIRMEAVRAGFKVCFENRDYRTIITIAQRIPEDVLQEDPKLLMWYDQAMTRMGEE
jgi:hypothetical protein